MRKSLAFTVALLVLVAAGCGKEKEEAGEKAAATPQGPALASSVWILESLGGEPVPQDAGITLRFGADGAVSGQAGCNSFNGTFSQRGDQLTFSPLASTRRACSQEIMDRETRFLAALAETERVEIEGGRTLVLEPAGEAEPLRLRRAPEPSLGDKPSVSGEVIFPGSPAVVLPGDGGQLTVRLLDVSNAEKGPTLLSRTVRTVRSSPPYPFRVVYALESIDGGGSYVVAAELEIAGEVRYRSADSVAVLTGGAPKENVEIRAEAVSP